MDVFLVLYNSISLSLEIKREYYLPYDTSSMRERGSRVVGLLNPNWLAMLLCRPGRILEGCTSLVFFLVLLWPFATN